MFLPLSLIIGHFSPIFKLIGTSERKLWYFCVNKTEISTMTYNDIQWNILWCVDYNLWITYILLKYCYVLCRYKYLVSCCVICSIIRPYYYRHVLPRNLLDKYEDDKSIYEQLLSHGEPIVIYMHGNSGTRANEHRVQLYHVLQDINCHVIAVDYRSMWQFYNFLFFVIYNF